MAAAVASESLEDINIKNAWYGMKCDYSLYTLSSKTKAKSESGAKVNSEHNVVVFNNLIRWFVCHNSLKMLFLIN